jgi:hypothetical protein
MDERAPATTETLQGTAPGKGVITMEDKIMLVLAFVELARAIAELIRIILIVINLNYTQVELRVGTPQQTFLKARLTLSGGLLLSPSRNSIITTFLYFVNTLDKTITTITTTCLTS